MNQCYKVCYLLRMVNCALDSMDQCTYQACKCHQWCLNLGHISILKEIICFKNIMWFHAILLYGLDKISNVLQLKTNVGSHTLTTCYRLFTWSGAIHYLEPVIVEDYCLRKEIRWNSHRWEKCYLPATSFKSLFWLFLIIVMI